LFKINGQIREFGKNLVGFGFFDLLFYSVVAFSGIIVKNATNRKLFKINSQIREFGKIFVGYWIFGKKLHNGHFQLLLHARFAIFTILHFQLQFTIFTKLVA
jgi:hypothetical protein